MRVDVEALKKRFLTDPRRVFYSTCFGLASDMLITVNNMLVQLEPFAELPELTSYAKTIRAVAGDLRHLREVAEEVEKNIEREMKNRRVA